MHTLARRSYRPVLVGYFITVAALVAGYPMLRGELLAKVFFAAELFAAFIGTVAYFSWRRRRETSTVTTTCTNIVVAAHLGVTVAGSYRFGLFGQAWTVTQWGYALFYAVIILLQAGSLWEPRKI
jgi:hypothetical protein